MNEQSVLRVLQQRGPCSRAEMARQLETTAPTISKAVASLLRAGLLEEFDVKENGRGRPAKRLRLANQTAQVIGLVIDAGHCRVVSAGMDGVLREENERRFGTPESYDVFLDRAVEHITAMVNRPDVSTMGIGISLPGLTDYRNECGILSPNVPITDRRSPSRDLRERLGIPCVTWQETHALCLAERRYGAASGLRDFAMLDVSTGVGLGVMSGGRLLTGHSGMAGEIGHIPVVDDGRPCGCGRRGCLETVASDSALTWSVSRVAGRPLDFDEIIELTADGTLDATREINSVCKRLSFALATVINLFNPSTLFVYGRLFELGEGLFERVVEQTQACALGPSFADCHIVRARGSKRLGAVAGIIEYLTDSRMPGFCGYAG